MKDKHYEIDATRFRFLLDTIGKIQSFVTSQTKSVIKSQPYKRILKALLTFLKDNKAMFTYLEQHKEPLTDNFDVLELTARRYLQQLDALFPLFRAKPDPPSELIQDKKAREAWEQYTGSKTYFITFADFIDMLKKYFPEVERTEFTEHLSYFVNYPNDDLICPFKWNCLMRKFGPFDEFETNFQAIVMGKGFLGLINRVTAEEILAKQPIEKKLLLMRFSRTEPNFMAFSYKDEEGAIQHSLNKKDSDPSQPMNVQKYLEEKFDGFERVPQKVKIQKLRKMPSLVDFARASSASLIESKRF